MAEDDDQMNTPTVEVLKIENSFIWTGTKLSIVTPQSDTKSNNAEPNHKNRLIVSKLMILLFNINNIIVYIRIKHWMIVDAGSTRFYKEDYNHIVLLEIERMRPEERERIQIAQERTRQEAMADKG